MRYAQILIFIDIDIDIACVCNCDCVCVSRTFSFRPFRRRSNQPSSKRKADEFHATKQTTLTVSRLRNTLEH